MKELDSCALTYLTLPVLHLAEVIAHDLMDSKSVSDLYRLRYTSLTHSTVTCTVSHTQNTGLCCLPTVPAFYSYFFILLFLHFVKFTVEPARTKRRTCSYYLYFANVPTVLSFIKEIRNKHGTVIVYFVAPRRIARACLQLRLNESASFHEKRVGPVYIYEEERMA